MAVPEPRRELPGVPARERVRFGPPEVVRDDYVAFCEGIRRLCEVDLLQYKRGQMERRIRTFAARRHMPSLRDYLALLELDASELDAFLDRVTINVSQLWRNPEQWALLGRTVLPELAAAGGRVRAWSAGCSYGAEAYTLLAVCAEAVPRARAQVLGSDIDRRMVERARRGLFSEEDARSAPRALLERHFEREDDGWRAREELRRGASFEVRDLLRASFPAAAYDLVLCRNTVIYFADSVRDRLHARLAASVRSGGYLMVGSTERVSSPAELGLSLTHPFVYRKD